MSRVLSQYKDTIFKHMFSYCLTNQESNLNDAKTGFPRVFQKASMRVDFSNVQWKIVCVKITKTITKNTFGKYKNIFINTIFAQ